MKGREKSHVKLADLEEAGVRAGKTLIFTLGVIKLVEIVASKKLL